MADSCRPVSRHGRYNSSGPSSVRYGGDVTGYGNVDYTPSDEMYTENQPERPERPKTSRGYRTEPPPRPVSRRSRKDSNDEESFGRPVSRVGFSPESSYRYSHEEFSRQVSSDNERQLQNSPCDQEILYRDDEYFNNQKALLQEQTSNHTAANSDRLIVSPSGPQDILGGSRRNHHGNVTKTAYSYGESPKSFGTSPQTFAHSPRYESQYRPTSREVVNVSPIQRDEAQIDSRSLHHDTSDRYVSDSPYQHEGDAYQQRFSDNTAMRNSPYRESPYQYRDSPYQHLDSPYQHRESPYQADGHQYGSSPANRGHGYSGSPEGHNRPPPAPRPKSARPKTAGRRKSARVRHRQTYQEQETSLPQECDTSSILNAGDPYGRPSSSLSPYKPLPAIGTPRGHEPDTNHQSARLPFSTESDPLTHGTQRLSLADQDTYHPIDDDPDIFTAEDIHGTNSDNLDDFAFTGAPNVDQLANVPQNLSDEIYQSSVAKYEQEHEHNDSMDTHRGNLSDKQSSPASVPKPLDFLHEIPDEPAESETRFLLAIKLPDGKRIQRHFRPTDSLLTVMHFAENSNLVNYEEYQLICNAPRTAFTDLTAKICDTQIKDRTVLYLEEKD